MIRDADLGSCDRAMYLRLRHAMFLLLALAWTLPVRALPDDRDARAPRWAAADLACATSDRPVPGCRDRGYAPTVLGRSSELLQGYLRRAVAARSGVRPTPSSSAAGAPQPSPPPPAQADELKPVTHALREVTAAMGLDANADILLAFANRRATGAGAPEGERLETARKLAEGFPFGVLFGWSASLLGIYQSAGARFDRVLFNAIDPPRLIAWNSVTPESAPERTTARVPTAGTLMGPGTAYSQGKAIWPDNRRVDAGASAEKKKRTIIYMERGRSTVMTVEDPPPK